MVNKFKLEGTALYVKHKVTPSGKTLISFMIECMNDQGYTSKIPVTCWHDSQNNEHLLADGQKITAIGALRNAPIKQKDGSTQFKLEAIVTDFKTSMTEVANKAPDYSKQQPIAPGSYAASTMTEQDVPF